MNHISQLMGNEDGNMALDVYSGGIAIEPLRVSMRKLSYGEEIDGYLLNYTTRIQFHQKYIT